MRILLCIGQLSTGGAERQFALLAGELVSAGHEVCFVTLTDSNDLEHYRLMLGSAQREVLFKRRHPGPLRFVQLSRGWVRLRRIIHQFNPDVVYSALEWTNWIAAQAVKHSRFPPALAVGIRTGNWGLDDLPWRQRLPIDRLAKHSSRAPIDALICNSEDGLKKAKRIGLHARVNRVVCNGIDSTLFVPNHKSRSEMRDRLGILDGDFLIGNVGRLDPLKNHKGLFEAFKVVREKHANARLLCVGSGPPDYSRALRDSASSMGIGQSLIWLDHAFNMPAVYSAMDCYVQSSILEGFSNVLAEAMSCGVPCVATDVGATESILGQEGILVRQGEPGSLASGIHELIEGDIRTSPGSRNRVMDLFSVHAMVEQTLTVFRELLR